jgi:acetyl-CoA carboxylase carboxyl transferase subunit alpha
MADRLQQALSSQLEQLVEMPIDQLLERRYRRLMAYGAPQG